MKYAENFGEIICDIAPKKSNPRNSEGAFCELDNGEIIFAYSRFQGESMADFAAADIALMRSADGGKTFRDEGVILKHEGEDGINIMSVSLLKMQNGDIGLFYLVRTTYSLMRMYLRRSSDNAKTWGERVICTPQEGFFVVNNDRVTRLSNGRIIIPAAIHRKGYCVSPDEEGEGYLDTRSDSTFFYSDDDGFTWKWAYGKCTMPHNAHCNSGLQEPGVIELAPGFLWGWSRTEMYAQYEMFSRDNGLSWTSPEPSRFSSPNSPLSMKRRDNGDIYAIWNPIPNYNGRSEFSHASTWHGGRTPLVIAVSRDNGVTFSEPVAFETEEEVGYCYCAVFFTKTHLLLGYCAGAPEDMSCLARIRIRRIPLEELENIG